ncbi:hypothetical protein EV401DRAFT_407008 [Pisolithus croceorrhizus]|nr:hypothetical protein EV401DRAFT_407008 [Pisolithus croceorrhizus]
MRSTDGILSRRLDARVSLSFEEIMDVILWRTSSRAALKHRKYLMPDLIALRYACQINDHRKASDGRVTGARTTKGTCNISRELRNGCSHAPLFHLSIPRDWRRDVIDGERRDLPKKFGETLHTILKSGRLLCREQFYTLLSWVCFYYFPPPCPRMLTFESHPTISAGDNRSPACRKLRFRGDTHRLVTRTIGRQQQAIEYFSDLFGIKCFESYVGKRTFFEKLSTGLELSIDSETPEAA